MSGYHVLVEADEDADYSMAGRVAGILCEAYPGYPWHVNIQGGMIVVKLMNISARMGIARRYDRVTFDAMVLKREIVGVGGEFLERAGLVRGMSNGDKPGHVDGIESRHRVIN